MAYQIEPFQGSDFIHISFHRFVPMAIDIEPFGFLTEVNLSQPDLNGALFAAAKRRQKSGSGRRKKLPKKLIS